MKMLSQLKRLFLDATIPHYEFIKPTADQKAFLESLPAPCDDIERSYFQYRCLCYLMNLRQKALLNIAAVPLLLWTSLRLRFPQNIDSEHAEAVFFSPGRDNILPNSLRAEFKSIKHVQKTAGYRYLSKSDRVYLRALRKRYPLKPFFYYECMKSLAIYSYMIECCTPKAIINSQQTEFTPSFLSDYCARRGVEHIGIMHGIQEYFIKISFLHFNRFYVWDSINRDLYISLKSPSEQFVIEVPPSLLFSKQTTSLEPVDYTYYLTNQSPQQMEKVIDCLCVLQATGAGIAVRPHPLFLNVVKPLFQDDHGFIVEDPKEIMIEDSILRTGCLISLGSTTLLQGAYNGKPIVIDDISVPGEYEHLVESGYCIHKMEHKRLSALLGEVSGGNSGVERI